MTTQRTATKRVTHAPTEAHDAETRAATLQHAATHSNRAASERFGIPQSTIRNWQMRERRRLEIVPTYPLKHGAYSPEMREDLRWHLQAST